MKKMIISALTLAIAACMSASPIISASASDDFVCGTSMVEQEAKEYETLNIKVPDKKYYKEGEQLDLTGGEIYLDDEFICDMNNPVDFVEVDTHQFISKSLPGVYPINVKATVNGKEFYGMFCVCVEESDDAEVKFDNVEIGAEAEEDSRIKDTELTLIVPKAPDKLVYNIGEELDFTGGIYEYYIHQTYTDGTDMCGCNLGSPITELIGNEKYYYGSVYIDSSEFDNTKEGVYTIYIKAFNRGAEAEASFDVEVKADDVKVEFDDVKIGGDSIFYGDVNLDGKVTISDSVRAMQYVANSEKYDLTDEQKANADVYNTGDGVTVKDAAVIESYVSGLVEALPVIL